MARFITFSCYERLPLIISDDIRTIILQEIERARIRFLFQLFAYVLMPEHVHLVLRPDELTSIGRMIVEIKSLAARRIVEALISRSDPILSRLVAYRDNHAEHAIWLPRCYDHNCRTMETTIEKINYCHWNPVKRGLVEKPEDWAWSSYRYYQGECTSPIEIGSLI